MKKLNLFIGLLIGLSILSCSSDKNDSEEVNDPIVGIWKQVRVVDLYNGEEFISNSDNCAIQNTHTFNSNQTFSFKFYDNEFSDCHLSLESISGNWNKNGSNYDINYIYRNVVTDEQFNSNENIEYDTREIFIEDNVLKIKYTFSPNEITIVEYSK